MPFQIDYQHVLVIAPPLSETPITTWMQLQGVRPVVFHLTPYEQNPTQIVERLIQVLQPTIPALAFIAQNLQNTDGVALTKEIRRHEHLWEMKTVVVGREHWFDKLRARLAGADDYALFPPDHLEIVNLYYKHTYR